MKRTILNVCILTCLAAAHGLAQTAGGSAGAGAAGAGAGAAAGAGTAGAGATVNGGNAGATINGGAAGTQTGNGTIQNRGGLPNKNGQAVNQNGQPVNRAAGTNNFGDNSAGNTNQFGANNNPNALTPPRGNTNRFYATNAYGTNFAGTNFNTTNTIAGTNGSGMGPQDRATTEFDRSLIVRMRQSIMLKLGGTAAAWAPVGISSQNGIVTLMGAVPSVVLKQRVVTTVQGTPGIVRVIDQLTVDPNISFAADSSAQGSGNIQPGFPVNPSQAQRPTFRTNQFGQPVLTPTGRPTGVPGAPPTRGSSTNTSVATNNPTAPQQ